MPSIAMHTCPAGRYSYSTSLSKESQCSICDPGHYCMGGSAKQSCEQGKYSTKENVPHWEYCNSYTLCKPGRFVSEKGTNSKDQTCDDCKNGTLC